MSVLHRQPPVAKPPVFNGPPPLASAALAGAGIAFVLLGRIAGPRSTTDFWHSYLVGFAYLLSLSLGALFFVLVQHACRAGWSVTVRRLAELVAGNICVLAFLFLPVLLLVLRQTDDLYPWCVPSSASELSVVLGKRSYLNPAFFALRAVVYFAVWCYLAMALLTRSVRQDAEAGRQLTLSMERLSYPGLLLFALALSFAAFDWLMSLTPTWYSTIFGVYFFSGAVVGALSLLVLLAMLLEKTGLLRGWITVEHYHDLGKLLFGFLIFWGYIAFSQYLLIWYANIPEETAWYQVRQEGYWAYVSVALLFGHLVVPFFGLLPRWAKRCNWALGFWAAWLLCFHWLDVHYLVIPHVRAGHDALFNWSDLTNLFGLSLLYAAGFLFLARGKRLVPIQDPRLNEALVFENV